MTSFRIGAFALIFDETNEVLFCLREDLGIWNLPGGGVERGESPWEAVVREVKEEIGLEVEIERLAGAYWRPRESEVAAFEEMPGRTNRRHVELVRDALDRLSETVMKVQAGLSSRELIKRGLL